MVYVLSIDGQPLMPTCKYGKVRHLLKSKRAKVVKRCPFTIQLLYETKRFTQKLTLGIDAGSKVIGVSVSSEDKEYYSAEITLRNDIVELLSSKRELRRSRRNRKTRYRAPRFNNRVHSKNKSWLAPSVGCKVNTHLRVIADVHKILPIDNIIVEVASFDIQAIKALENGQPLPEGMDYQNGEQRGFWNVRQYVLWRDNYTCQCCKGKSKDKVLNVHHIKSRKTGGNAPNNLITLCEYCHKQYHEGNIELKVKRGASYRDAAFMGIMRWTVFNRLKELYPNVSLTYGYITKDIRITHKLLKEHRIDALCITGHPNATPCSEWFYQKKVRCHNRQIHKCTVGKGGVRKLNQSPFEVKGFRLFDKVLFNGEECFIFGRRATGSFNIRKLDGTKINAGVNYKKLVLLKKRKTILTERKMQAVA